MKSEVKDVINEHSVTANARDRAAYWLFLHAIPKIFDLSHQN